MAYTEVEQREFDLNKLTFEKSLALRNFEIDNFWKRGWFFGALILAIATAYFGCYKDSKEYCIYASFLGLLVSFLQSLMNRGSKYWQERWETKTKNSENAIGIDLTTTQRFFKKEKYYLDASIRAKNENGLTVARRFSVSKLTILVWDLFTFFWFFLWLQNWNFSFNYTLVRWDAVLIHSTVFCYIFFFFYGKTRRTTLADGTKNKKHWFDIFTFQEGGGGKVYQRLVNDIKELDKAENRVSKTHAEDSDKYTHNKI